MFWAKELKKFQKIVELTLDHIPVQDTGTRVRATYLYIKLYTYSQKDIIISGEILTPPLPYGYI